MSSFIHPVILCGGSGTRLWPLSTPETPKQFLALTSARSMIEDTALRFENQPNTKLKFASILVVGAKRHQDLLDAKLPQAQKILEPCGRNSAPAVAAACLARKPDDLVLILPADHDIQDLQSFHDAIAIAADAAEEGAIVTFGIKPTHPETGYGYIKARSAPHTRQAIDVEEFVEKPDLETAKRYLDTGVFFWNAGIFLFKASIMLDALQSFAPDVLSGVKAAMRGKQGKTIDLTPEAFASIPSISIDFAVLEKAENVKTVPVSMGWSDVGSFRALHGLLTDQDTDNVTSGPVFVRNTSGSYIRSEGPTIAVNGISNLIIVATKDQIMVTTADDPNAAKVLGKAVRD